GGGTRAAGLRTAAPHGRAGTRAVPSPRVARAAEPVVRGAPGPGRVALLPVRRRGQPVGLVGGGDAAAAVPGGPPSGPAAGGGGGARCRGCRGRQGPAAAPREGRRQPCRIHDVSLPTVPGSCWPNGGKPGTSATKGAASNQSFGTSIP